MKQRNDNIQALFVVVCSRSKNVLTTSCQRDATNLGTPDVRQIDRHQSSVHELLSVVCPRDAAFHYRRFSFFFSLFLFTGRRRWEITDLRISGFMNFNFPDGL